MENTTEPNNSTDSTTPKTGEIKPTDSVSEPTVFSPETSSPEITTEPATPASTDVDTPVESPTTPLGPVTPESPAPMEATTDSPAETVSEPTTSTPANTAETLPITSEVSEPEAPVIPPTASTSTPPLPGGHSRLKMILLAVVALIVLAGAAAGSYMLGKHKAKPMASTTSTNTSMAIPAGATIIEKCEPGLGTQYILPKDIPDGPVYNVYQGKIIGIEYMADLASLQKIGTMLENLPLYAQKYDHINIMSMDAHAGYPKPHYQVDVMMVPAATTKKITCGSSSSSMSDSNSSSDTMSSDSSSSTSKM